MNIEFNNPLNNIFSTENLSIKGVTSESNKTGNDPANNDKVELSSIAQKLDKILSDLRDTESVEKAQDIKNTLELEENTGLYKLVMPSDEDVDGLVSALSKNGSEIPKPDGNINDVQWGAMVRLGHTVGIEDKEVLAGLTAQDLDLFYNEFVEKEGITDPSVKQFEDTDTFWKTVFQTDENGNFLKENGKAVHNTDFEFIKISKPDIGLRITGPNDIVSVYGNMKFDRTQDHSTELTAVSPEAILRWDDAITHKNDTMKWMALGKSSSGDSGYWQPNLEDGTTEESFYRRELGFYMLQTKTNFNNDYVRTADTNYVTESFHYNK